MHVRTIGLLSLLFVVDAHAQARWTETFVASAANRDREAACSEATNSARVNATSACLARHGARVNDERPHCSCSADAVARAQVCSATFTIQCERS